MKFIFSALSLTCQRLRSSRWVHELVSSHVKALVVRSAPAFRSDELVTIWLFAHALSGLSHALNSTFGPHAHVVGAAQPSRVDGVTTALRVTNTRHRP
jgi:hypothetical protein